MDKLLAYSYHDRTLVRPKSIITSIHGRQKFMNSKARGSLFLYANPIIFFLIKATGDVASSPSFREIFNNIIADATRLL